jgi:hypothetical protein
MCAKYVQCCVSSLISEAQEGGCCTVYALSYNIAYHQSVKLARSLRLGGVLCYLQGGGAMLPPTSSIVIYQRGKARLWGMLAGLHNCIINHERGVAGGGVLCYAHHRVLSSIISEAQLLRKRRKLPYCMENIERGGAGGSSGLAASLYIHLIINSY